MHPFVRIRLATLGLVALTVLLALPGGALAGAARVSFEGGYAATNPCNGENLAGPVGVDMLYQTVEGHHNVHVKVTGTFTGDQGNTYTAMFISNAVLDAPSYVADGAAHFLVPMRAVFVGQGATPDFTQKIVADVGVVDGQPDSVWTVEVVPSCRR